jgi:hypothetical protein
MQLESHVVLDEEICPVPEEMLGEMYRANADGLVKLVETVSPAARAMLAIYCYRRTHLALIGLTIAATCEKEDLASVGGNAGVMLYDRSREAPLPSLSDVRSNERRKITLPSGPLCQPISISEDEESLVAVLSGPEACLRK